MAYVRENPTRVPTFAPIKAPMPANFGIKNMAARIGGPMHNYLGSFAKPKTLSVGHAKFADKL